MPRDVQWFTVVGIYAEDGQRYCDSVEADSPKEAEAIVVARRDHPDLRVAAVFKGYLYPVDGEEG